MSTDPEVVQSANAAKKQRIENEKLRTLVVDCEEHLLRLQQNTAAQRKLTDFMRAMEREKTAMGEFEKGFNLSTMRKFNPAKFITECSQTLTMKELITPDMVPTIESVGKAMDTLRAMKGSLAANNPLATMMDNVLRYLDKCITLLKDSKLDSQRWTPMLDPVFTLLYDVAKQRPFRDSLIEVEEKVRRMKFEADDVSEKQGQAILEGDMRLAEQLYYQKLSILETVTQEQAKKIENLNEEEAHAFKEPLCRVHEVHKRSSCDVTDLITFYGTLKKNADGDLRKVQSELERITNDDYNAQRQFLAAKELNSNALKENAAKHEAAIRKIDEAEKELLQLALDRGEEIRRRMSMVEAEARRRIDAQHFFEFAAQHTTLLETTIHNCEIAEEITDTIDEAISNSCKDLEKHLRQVERDIESLRQEVHLANLEGFRGFYLTLGDLLYKKERNVEEMEKKIHMAHMQQELAMETLNPRAKEFSQLKKDLAKVKEEMEVQVLSLKDRQTLCIEEYKPTEQALRIAGVPFVSPVDELADKNKARDIKLIEYHELMAQNGGEAGTAPEEVAPVSETDLVRESQEIEKLRASMQPRKPTTANGTRQK
eukprot:PhF_6_TR13652/c0_g1_i1/m.21902